MERQVKLTGELTPAPMSGLQPRAYHTLGRNLYHLEDSVSGLRTAKVPSMQEAVGQWETITKEATR